MMAIKRYEMSRQAAFIAKNSAAWSADFLTLPECVTDTINDDSVKRYLDEMRGRLDMIETMNGESN